LQLATDTAVYLFDDWFDPIEAGVRDRVRGFIQATMTGAPGTLPGEAIRRLTLIVVRQQSD
jgi:hypothetical protein